MSATALYTICSLAVLLDLFDIDLEDLIEPIDPSRDIEGRPMMTGTAEGEEPGPWSRARGFIAASVLSRMPPSGSSSSAAAAAAMDALLRVENHVAALQKSNVHTSHSDPMKNIT